MLEALPDTPVHLDTTRIGRIRLRCPCPLLPGRLEGGLLYTPAYLRAVKSQLRGALRAVVAPVILAALVREAGLGTGAAGGDGGGAGVLAALASGGGGGVVATLVEELVAEGKE